MTDDTAKQEEALLAEMETRPGMALFATGFNAWNQLSLAQNLGDEEPRDLFYFTKVLEAQQIERPVAGLSYTLGASICLRRFSGSIAWLTAAQYGETASFAWPGRAW